MAMKSTTDYPFQLKGAWGDTSHSGASLIRKQLSNWLPTRLPADADLLPDLPTLVSRARDLDRNNGVAAGVLQTLQDNVAGIGLRLAASPDYRALGKTIDWAEEWSRNVESLWKNYADSTAVDVAGQLNFASMTQLIFRSALENGEALALVMWMDRGMETPFRTCFQLVESDRLSNPYYKPPTLALIGGIEKDAFGRPIAYWIRKEPQLFSNVYTIVEGGGFGVSAPGELTSWAWDRIPAQTTWSRKRVLHVHQKERIAQTRGRPVLTPVIEQFRMLDSYQRTELQSAIVNALIAGVIETPLDSNTLADLVGGDPDEYLAAKNEYRVQLEGGTMIPLYPGDKLAPFMPTRPNAQFSQFVESIDRQIGTAVGLPYELVLKDFSKTNYSSARAALLEAWRHFAVRRAWLAEYWAAPVYRLWLEEATQRGLIDAPDFYDNYWSYCRAKWIGMGRGWIDPVKEAEAAQLRMQSGVSTLELECAEQGQDWNEILEQQALEAKRRELLGLPPMSLQIAPISQEKPAAPATGQPPGQPPQQPQQQPQGGGPA
jgi:lambda family phage portal protein